MGLAFNAAVDHVGIDIGPAVREAVGYLVGLGRPRGAYVCPATFHVAGNVRLEADQSAIAEAGLARELIVIDGARHGAERRAAREAIRAYAQDRGAPGALLL